MSLQMEDVRSRLLPRDLELQLLVGRAVESLYLADSGQPLSEADLDAIRACANRLRQGAAELGTEARTLAQSADAADVVRAGQRALGTEDDAALRTGLVDLADALAALATPGCEIGHGEHAKVAERLMRLHDALSDATAVAVEGFGQAWGGGARSL